MAYYKEQIIAGILIILAFIGGYKQNSLIAYLESSSEEPPRVASAETKQPAPAVKAVEQVQIPPSSAPRPPTPPPPRIAGKTPPYAGMYQRTPSSIQPYSDSFKSTMEAIRPGKIGKQQNQQRNLYFDHLREQLKHLQGQTPPQPAQPAQIEQNTEEAAEKERRDRDITAAARNQNGRDMDTEFDDTMMDPNASEPPPGEAFDPEDEVIDDDLEETIAEILAEESL